MKNLSKIAMVAAGLAAAFPFVNAASSADNTSNAPAATAPAGLAATHPRLHAMMQHRRAIGRRIARKLNLNPDQITQLKTIRGATRSTLMTIRANASLTPDQKRAQAREVLQSSRTQMHAVLTPDQQAKLEEIKNLAWQRLGGF